MSVSLEVVKELLEAHRALFQWMMDDLKSEVKGLRKELGDVKTSIQFVSNENDSINIKIKLSEENSNKLSKKLEIIEANMYDTVEDMLDKQEYLENQSRRNNLKLIGGPEDSSENSWDETENTVKALIKSELGIDEEITIERAHRVGKPYRKPRKGGNNASTIKEGEAPRHIVAKFQSWKVKEKVIQKAREVKPASVKFVNDFSRRTMEKRSSRIQEMIDARKAGKLAYFVNGCNLVIKEKQPVSTQKIKHQNKLAKPPDINIGLTATALDVGSDDDEVVLKKK
eukprot:gene12576-13865_t